MTLDALRTDISKRGKKGLHFIAASILIWCLVLLIWSLPIAENETKNLFTFVATSILMPLAYGISRLIKAEFSTKDNPLNQLGLIFSLNQFLYILIAMWVYPTVPDKMVMVLAMIFGAHLLPFGWLYQSKAYTVMAVLIPLIALFIGITSSPAMVALAMIVLETVFTLWLVFENRAQSSVKPGVKQSSNMQH